MEPLKESSFQPPSDDESAGIPDAPPLPIDIEVARIARERPQAPAIAAKAIEKPVQVIPTPPAQLQMAMILGNDQFDGPLFRSFHEALYEGVDRLVVSYSLAATALSRSYQEQIQQIPLQRHLAAANEEYDRLLKSLDDLPVDSPKRKTTEEQIAAMKTQAAQTISTAEARADMVDYNHKWVFSRYQIHLHESGTYLVFTRKGMDQDSRQAIPTLSADKFVPIRNYTQLETHPISGSLYEQLTPAKLLDSVPTERRDMVLYLMGHGLESVEGVKNVAGVPVKEFQEFLQSVERQDHRDLVVVTSCYSGGRALEYFPGATPAERAASKTTYVVTSLGSVVATKGKIADFPRFFQKSSALLAHKGKQLRDYEEVIETVSDSFWMNQPQVRFPSTGPFQAVRDSSTVYNLSSVRLLGQLSQDPSVPLAIPAGIQMVDVRQQDVPISLQLPNIPPTESFALYTHQPSTRIKELIMAKGASLISLLGGFREIWEMHRSQASVVSIDRITMTQGETLTDVIISLPESGAAEGRRPRMSFFDSQQNFYTVDLFGMQISCLGRPGEADPMVEEQRGFIEKLFFPMTVLNFARNQLRELTVDYVKSRDRARVLRHTPIAYGPFTAAAYRMHQGSTLYRLEDRQADLEEVIEIPVSDRGIDCRVQQIRTPIKTPALQSDQPFVIVGSPEIQLTQLTMPQAASLMPLLLGAKEVWSMEREKPHSIRIKKLSLGGDVELHQLAILLPLKKEAEEPPLLRFFDAKQNLYLINMRDNQVTCFAKEDQASVRLEQRQLLATAFPGAEFVITDGRQEDRWKALQATGGDIEEPIEQPEPNVSAFLLPALKEGEESPSSVQIPPGNQILICEADEIDYSVEVVEIPTLDNEQIFAILGTKPRTTIRELSLPRHLTIWPLVQGLLSVWPVERDAQAVISIKKIALDGRPSLYHVYLSMPVKEEGGLSPLFCFQDEQVNDYALDPVSNKIYCFGASASDQSEDERRDYLRAVFGNHPLEVIFVPEADRQTVLSTLPFGTLRG